MTDLLAPEQENELERLAVEMRLCDKSEDFDYNCPQHGLERGGTR